MTRLCTALLALALVTPLAACSETDDAEFRDVSEFVDGMAVNSDSGAFRVVLSSEDGRLGTGRNDLIVRVGFHDPSNPDAEGRGIPNAEVLVDAWMPDTELSMQSEIEVTYLGDGAYAVENVVLDRSGVWNVDIEISVGDGMHERVSLAFEVDDLDYRG
jgi:hypothetical protein